jgi:hypothetical protein
MADKDLAPRLLARRSRDGQHVVCGRRLPNGGICGERLACILLAAFSSAGLDDVSRPIQFMFTEHGLSPLALIFEGVPELPFERRDEWREVPCAVLRPGWVRGGDRVWTLSAYARRRWDATRAAAARGDRGAAKRLSDCETATRWRRPIVHRRYPGWRRYAGEIGAAWDRERLARERPMVRCPTCGLVNEFAPALLDGG